MILALEWVRVIVFCSLVALAGAICHCQLGAKRGGAHCPRGVGHGMPVIIVYYRLVQKGLSGQMKIIAKVCIIFNSTLLLQL